MKIKSQHIIIFENMRDAITSLWEEFTAYINYIRIEERCDSINGHSFHFLSKQRANKI